MKKKKKKNNSGHKSKASKGRSSVDFLAEAKEEMIALSAIFDSSFEVHEDERGFNLLVVPHPGQADDNFVSVKLVARYPTQYPAAQLLLKLSDAEGLEATQVRKVAKALHLAAAQYARAEQVCAFNLATVAQEHLQDLNEPPKRTEQPASLWHEMQAREQEAESDVLDVSGAADDLVWGVRGRRGPSPSREGSLALLPSFLLPPSSFPASEHPPSVNLSLPLRRRRGRLQIRHGKGETKAKPGSSPVPLARLSPSLPSPSFRRQPPP